METFRVIIAGGRFFNKPSFLKSKMDSVLRNVAKPIVVISGHCTDKEGNCIGADHWGEEYAKERGFGLETYPADWNKYGDAAGPIRNREMAKKKIDAVAVFWDGKSRGSRSMIEIAEELKLPLRIFKY